MNWLDWTRSNVEKGRPQAPPKPPKPNPKSTDEVDGEPSRRAIRASMNA